MLSTRNHTMEMCDIAQYLPITLGLTGINGLKTGSLLFEVYKNIASLCNTTQAIYISFVSVYIY